MLQVSDFYANGTLLIFMEFLPDNELMIYNRV